MKNTTSTWTGERELSKIRDHSGSHLRDVRIQLETSFLAGDVEGHDVRRIETIIADRVYHLYSKFTRRTYYPNTG